MASTGTTRQGRSKTATRTTGAARANAVKSAQPRRPRKTTGTAGVDPVMDSNKPATQAEQTTVTPHPVEIPAEGAALAARRATRSDAVRVPLPLLGSVSLPREQLAFLAGVTVLGVAGAVEWPVVVLLGVGHALVNRRHNKVLREFGEALQEV